jgi:hypothetical protein
MDAPSKKRRPSVVPVQRQNDRVGVWDDDEGVFTQANRRGPSQFVQTEGKKFMMWLLCCLFGRYFDL